MNQTTPPFTREDLKCLHILRDVDISAVEPLLRNCPIKDLAPDEVVIAAGHENRYLYLILSGRVRIQLKSLDESPIARLEAGESIGELSMIDRRPASAYAVADAPTRLLMIDEEIMWTLVDRSHAVSSNLLFSLSQRIRYGNEVIYQNLELLQEYRFQALIDPLTGLYNRRWLKKMLPRQIDRCFQDGKSMSLLMIDIDHFKLFNDQNGHLAGDQALGTVAMTIQEGVRPGDLTARFGGEEIIVLLPDANLETASVAADRLLSLVRNAKITSLDGQDLPSVTISLGISQMQDNSTPDTLLHEADMALYRAKHGGRNRYSI
ncbi:MAG: GGDEF domain-containing protein [Gammaproteobacteria bacterium]|nr:GGDEF domain-containing protein [Gammaproteobacteria bacterium]